MTIFQVQRKFLLLQGDRHQQVGAAAGSLPKVDRVEAERPRRLLPHPGHHRVSAARGHHQLHQVRLHPGKSKRTWSSLVLHYLKLIVHLPHTNMIQLIHYRTHTWRCSNSTTIWSYTSSLSWRILKARSFEPSVFDPTTFSLLSSCQCLTFF